MYKETYKRRDGMKSDVSNTRSGWRDCVVMWLKDASRAIGYAQTRFDLRPQKVGYYETEHNIPRHELVKEGLDWLDLYFSAVNGTRHELVDNSTTAQILRRSSHFQFAP